jgi:hypothetical protein
MDSRKNNSPGNNKEFQLRRDRKNIKAVFLIL